MGSKYIGKPVSVCFIEEYLSALERGGEIRTRVGREEGGDAVFPPLIPQSRGACSPPVLKRTARLSASIVSQVNRYSWE